MNKTGFSTLNRWLGRKNKDKSLSNGKLSKSNTNLSISSTNLNDSLPSLEYNRITPLPIVTSNAPFEQTFRITVLLPKDQLYVARLGARVPLSKLLELVCDNKQLDRHKYEFRNPVDPSQVYSCDLTIGAVGLSEIRLCHISESYDSFNTDEILKLQRTSIIRDSLSSSEFSSRFSKHTNKTASPYSSTNSLNSMDSSGLNYSRSSLLMTNQHHIYHHNNQQHNNFVKPMKIVAPPRKKRTAPRPPSQISIPEKEVLVTMHNGGRPAQAEESMPSPIAVTNHCVSTPNLNQQQPNNSQVYHHHSNGYGDDTVVYAQVQKKNAHNLIDSSTSLHKDDNGIGGKVSGVINNQSENDDNVSNSVPEPTPRKRNFVAKKKSAPAPPPRHSLCLSDCNEELEYHQSTQTLSSSESSTIGVGDYATVQEIQQQRAEEAKSIIPIPKARNNLSGPLANSTGTEMEIEIEIATETEAEEKVSQRITEEPSVSASSISRDESRSMDLEVEKYANNRIITAASTPNISKTMLNCSPPLPLVGDDLSLRDSPHSDCCYEDSHLDGLKQNGTAVDDDNASKQADSGIGEPGGPSPLPDSLPVSEMSANECKSSNFESSSDDDDLVKVYNFKLGKTMVKPLNDQEQVVDKAAETTTTTTTKLAESSTETTTSPTSLSLLNEKEEQSRKAEELKNWGFSMPISPPPIFADGKQPLKLEEGTTPAPPTVAPPPPPSLTSTTTITMTTTTTASDIPITPKITERPILDFAALQKDESTTLQQQDRNEYYGCSNIRMTTPPLLSPTTPLNGLVEELSLIINGKGIDSLIRKPQESEEVEAATENTLQNFTITTAAVRGTATSSGYEEKEKEKEEVGVMETISTDHRESIMNGEERRAVRRSISRADSLHSVVTSSSTSAVVVSSNGEREEYRSSSQLSLTTLECSGIPSHQQQQQKQQQQRQKYSNSHPNDSIRCSSSELSIGDSPSLQSLEVIKTILSNNRQSLLVSSAEKATEMVDSSRRPSTELKFTSLEMKPKKVDDGSMVLPSSPPLPPPATPPKPTSKMNGKPKAAVYRYSGPPSINLSTWSERPKMQQVAIKNEGDYIFGGKGAAIQIAARNAMKGGSGSSGGGSGGSCNVTVNGRSHPVQSPLPPPEGVNGGKMDILTRMGLHGQAEFKAPLSIPVVRPLQDVVYERKEGKDKDKEDEGNVQEKNVEEYPSMSAGESKNTTLPRTLPKISPQNELIGRDNNNRGVFSLRPMSIGKGDRTIITTTTTASSSVAPFGQNTLRRTGLKEKILAGEESTSSSPPSLSSLTSNSKETEIAVTKKTLLNCQLKKQTSMVGSGAVPPPPLPPVPVHNSTTTTTSSSLKRAVKSAPVTPATEDTRDQLLEAIRNFNRSQLKRSE